jgi:hypothetical protein
MTCEIQIVDDIDNVKPGMHYFSCKFGCPGKKHVKSMEITIPGPHLQYWARKCDIDINITKGFNLYTLFFYACMFVI